MQAGQTFVLTTRDVPGDASICAITYKDLPGDIAHGARVLLDDGLIAMTVEKVEGTDITCTVKNGGWVSNPKGVNVPGTKLSIPYMSATDVYKRQLPPLGAGQHIAVHGAEIVERRGRQHVVGIFEVLHHIVVQRRCVGAVRIAHHLDLRQIAPGGKHLLGILVGGDAQADHHDDGAGAHHHADNCQRGAALAAAKVICAELQQDVYKRQPA